MVTRPSRGGGDKIADLHTKEPVGNTADVVDRAYKPREKMLDAAHRFGQLAAGGTPAMMG